MASRDDIRPTGVAGLFYPADKFILERDVSLLLENSPVVEFPRPVRGMIVPHAGYIYSGGVSARAYRQILRRQYDVIVLVAPSHEEEFEFPSIFPGKALSTPLGDIPLDVQSIDKLVAADAAIRLSKQGYGLGEHSLEVHLPFLKWVQERIKIIPIMMGRQNIAAIRLLHTAISDVLKTANLLIIGSTDLSHFYPDRKARKMDQIVIDRVTDFDDAKLYEDIRQHNCEMCGFGPAIVTMNVARNFGAKEGNMLLYRNSGDITGERDSVVGYLSAVFY